MASSSSSNPSIIGLGAGYAPPAQFPPYVDSHSSPSLDSAAASSSSSSSASIIIIIIVIASAVILSAGIYLLLRFISRRVHRSRTSSNQVVSRNRDFSTNLNSNRPQPSGILDSLPLFTFGSVNGNLGGGDCAVCLSKFEADDQLRLLPLCCHAFHVSCIDAWIVSNQTCPLCRSAVISSDAELLKQIEPGLNSSRGNRSFRIEIGSISRRGGGSLGEAVEGEQRSYSMGGSLDYIVNETGYEIPAGLTTHSTGISECNLTNKESSIGMPPGDALAAEVSGGRNWLQEYVDRLGSFSISSRVSSLRGSGRFFSGSSRRSEHTQPAADPEANLAGEEISEFFRWLSEM